MGYNECVARIYRAENGWSVEISQRKKPAKPNEIGHVDEKTYLATDWAGVLKILNSNVKGKGAEADYAEAFEKEDKE